ncbi:hypothetical protein ABID59_002156 [Bradyrhizobium sp. S3.3.6]
MSNSDCSSAHHQRKYQSQDRSKQRQERGYQCHAMLHLGHEVRIGAQKCQHLCPDCVQLAVEFVAEDIHPGQAIVNRRCVAGVELIQQATNVIVKMAPGIVDGRIQPGL